MISVIVTTAHITGFILFLLWSSSTRQTMY